MSATQAEVWKSGWGRNFWVTLALNGAGDGKRLSKALECLCMEVMQPRRHFCPLPPASQQWEVGMLSPHRFGAGSSSSSYPVPVGRRGQLGQTATPTYLSASSQTPKRKGKNQLHSLPQHCLGTPRALGCRERPPGSASCTPSPLGPAMATLYSHHSTGAMGRARAAENSSFTFSKNTVPLFPLDPISYLLTVVKYYCSSPPSQAGFPFSPRYPPLFFF